MGLVYEELVTTLAGWRKKYAAQPQQEILSLLLLALEREQLVTVGYRESALQERLANLNIPQEIHDIIRQALLWTWQDEEMHAVYVRGALLRVGRYGLALNAVTRQIMGGLGGWTGAVQQHLPWKRAPLVRLLAAGIMTMGVMMGAVPKAVRRHLHYGSFRDYCLFNVDAERTAALCFNRLNELLTTHALFPHAMVVDLMKIQADEERHEQLFAVLAEVFTDGDEIIAGVTAASLAERLAKIDLNFLPRIWRPQTENVLGSMAPVTVIEINPPPADPTVILHTALIEAQVATLLINRASLLNKSVTDLRVAIKPSFMFAYHRNDPSPITDPRLVIALAKWFRGFGVTDIAVLESPSVYSHFFMNRSVAELATYVGMESPDFRVIDMASD
jgi:hypothetical protein